MGIKELRPTSESTPSNPKQPYIIPIVPFGKYTMIAKLGRGGMAEVFLAYVAGPAGFRKLVVIKRLHPHLEEEPEFVEMFLDEARLSARLNHPNIVQTYEVGEVDGSHFIALEHLEGQSLLRIFNNSVNSGTPVPSELAAYIVGQTLEGLNYAHELCDYDDVPIGIVHRDISPQNIFVTYEGQVKLLDFGIARASTHLAMTRVGVIKGKFSYAAPEQIQNEAIDRRADLWSMGVVLWEILANERLFKGVNEIAALPKALTADIRDLKEVAPDTPDDLVDVCGNAITRDKADRYQTAVEMKDDLDAFLSAHSFRTSNKQLTAFVRKTFKDDIERYRSTIKTYLSESEEARALLEMRDLGGQSSMKHTTSGMRTIAPDGQLASGSISTQYTVEPAEPQQKQQRRMLFWLVLIALIVICFTITINLALFYNRPNHQGGGGNDTIVGDPTILQSGEAMRGDLVRPSERRVGDIDSVREELPTEAQQPDDRGSAPEEDSSEDRGLASPPVGKGSPHHVRPQKRRPLKLRTKRRPVVDVSPRGQRVDEELPTVEPPTPQTDFGFLTLDTIPWSEVSLGGTSLGTTPIIRVRLPEGDHVLTLSNPDTGASMSYRVTITAGEVTARRTAVR